jgi:hypothetical protein
VKTRHYVSGIVAASAALSLVAVGIAEAQDPTGIVSQAWEVGGPIAAVVAIMLLASGIAIRTLWNQLQAERRALGDLQDKRNTDTGTYVREMRDCITGVTAALNRFAERLEDAGRDR